VWDLARKRAGIEDVHLHDLRRTYASLAANVNVPPAVLQGLLGHAKYETTEGYVQLFDRTKAASAERVASLAAALLEGRPDADVIKLRQRHEHSP
jgi:integrase